MKTGFTLIELLVVVLIIAVLAAIALPQYQKAIDRAAFQRMDMVVRSFVRQYEWYYLENGTYPTDWTKMGFSYPGCSVTKNNHVTCDEIKFAGHSLSITYDASKYITFSPHYFRNWYYPIRTATSHQAEWRCYAYTSNGARGSKLCKSICGKNDCYYK